MLLIAFIICLLLGAIVGILSGLLGIGGGLVIVPALVHLLPMLGVQTDIVLPIALATSLASIVITSSSAAYAHHKNDNIPWSIARGLMLSVAIGAALGAWLANDLSSNVLSYIFSFSVMLLASYMLYSLRKSQKFVEIPLRLPRHSILQLFGLFTGILASLMGIAGGAILIPLLSYFGVNVRHAIGAATACGCMVALFGSFGYVLTGLSQPNLPQWSLGYVYLPALLGIILTSSFTAPIGVKLASKLPTRTLKKCFAVFLIFVAIKMLNS